MSKITMAFISLMVLAMPSVAAELTNQSELSIITTSGNSDLSTYNTKTMSKYAKDNQNFQLGGHYTKGENEGTESASNWDINARYGYIVSKKIGTFVATQYENDNFAGIKYRHNTDVGMSYIIKKSKKTNASAELGYRYRNERLLGQEEADGDSQGRVYLEGSRQNTETLFTMLWVEYLPNISTSKDWQVKFEPSVNFAISSNFSLKVGYLYRYDNKPAPFTKRYDTTYSTTLIAKF